MPSILHHYAGLKWKLMKATFFDALKASYYTALSLERQNNFRISDITV